MSDRRSQVNWDDPARLRRLKRRYAGERAFRYLGRFSILLAASFLGYLLLTVVYQGFGGFQQTFIKASINLDDPAVRALEGLEGDARADALRNLPTRRLIGQGLIALFPDVTSRADRRELARMISIGARQQIAQRIAEHPTVIGTTQDMWLLADDTIDQLAKGNVDITLAPENRRVSDQQVAWVQSLRARGLIKTQLTSSFFNNADSREPELAGISGALMGTLLTIGVTLLLAFPVGVLSAIYLEEFARDTRATRLLEVNINNLAAVPSIVFGLLGLSVFLGTFSMPRSAPLVGGLTLALMTLPAIIIASRAAIRAVPGDIRDAASALGASPQQVVFHHVMPIAMPGVITGTIIGLARAIGETAPLLMVGMVAFVVSPPRSIFDASTALPVQIYLWANSLERAFVEKTSAAILVLLLFLIALNALAALVRRRFAKKL